MVFIDCIVYNKGKLFSGTFELNQGDKDIISYVEKGFLKTQKTYKNQVLIMEKKFSDCTNGYQKVFDINGKIKSEGLFYNNKRKGLWKNYSKDSLYFIKY